MSALTDYGFNAGVYFVIINGVRREFKSFTDIKEVIDQAA